MKKLLVGVAFAAALLATPALASIYSITNATNTVKQISVNGTTQQIAPGATVLVNSDVPLNIPNNLQLNSGSPGTTVIVPTSVANSSTPSSVSVTSTVLAADQATASNQTTGNTTLSNILANGATAANQTAGNTSLSTIATNGATGAKQDTGNTSLAAINTKVATAANQASEISALTNIATATATEATAAKQDTGNTSLSTIATNGATAANQATMNTTLSSILAGEATAANQTTMNTTLSSLLANTPAVGQKTAANSSPVTIASDQSPVSTNVKANAPAVDSTGSLSASGDTVSVVATGMNTAIIRLPSTAWTGSAVVEGTSDGTNYDVPLSVQLYASAGNTGSLSTLTAGGTYEVTITGLSGVRVRATSAITGGPISALVRVANGNKSIRVGAPANNPVPVTDANNASFTNSVALTVGGANVAAGRSIEFICTQAGNINFTWPNNTTHAVSVSASPYTQTLPYSAVGIASSGTTATCTYANLY